MALTKTTTLNEFFVRLKDDGSGIQGMHVADREAVLEDGVEISSRMLNPRGVTPGDSAALGTVAAAINIASLATIDQLVAAVSEAEAARDAALAQVNALQAEINELRPAPVNGVPQEVTMRQAQLALLGAGLLDKVEGAIASMPGDAGRAAQITWGKSSAVRRDNTLIAALKPALSLSDAQIDALFVAAAKL